MSIFKRKPKHRHAWKYLSFRHSVKLRGTDTYITLVCTECTRTAVHEVYNSELDRSEVMEFVKIKGWAS